MKKHINWGIIGLGKIANKFARDIKHASNAKLFAVASRSQEKADAFAKEHGAVHAFGSYEDLLNCPNLDAVYIASPHVLHCEHTLMCLEANLHVLCEKPFAMNGQEVKKMVEKAREKDVFLMEALWTRFLPTMSQTQKLIADGEIGEVFSIRADFGFKAPFLPEQRLYNKELGGGALLDIGIYPVFLALFLFGYPDEMKAMARIGETGVDEEIAIIFKYKDGRMADLHSTILTRTNTEAYIYGSEGTIFLRERWFNPTDLEVTREGEEKTETITFDYKGGGFEYEIEAASQAILEGKKEHPKMPLSFSLELMKLLDDIRAEIGLVYPTD